MDLGLPQLRGTEATRWIRELDGGAEVKIAAITASAYALGCDGVMRAGFDDLTFKKPFRQKNIFLCLARRPGCALFVFGRDRRQIAPAISRQASGVRFGQALHLAPT